MILACVVHVLLTGPLDQCGYSLALCILWFVHPEVRAISVLNVPDYEA